MRYKIILFIFLQVIIFNFLSVSYQAASSNTITKTAEFTTENKKPNYDEFDKKINEEDSIYILSDIKYNLLDTKKEAVTENKTTKIIKDNLSSKIYSLDRDASYYQQNLTIDGKEYRGTLLKVEYEDYTKTNRYGEVSGSKDYGLRTSEPSPPKTMPLQYYDSDTKQTLVIDAPLISLITTNTEWQDYTYIDITVNNYTDTQFMFDDKIIKHNGDEVLPSKYYDKLLDMAGLSNDNHRIKTVYWTGDVYEQGNKKYRKARADIQAYACSYRAQYYKKFSLKDVPAYTAILTYSYKKENVQKSVYTYEAIATYKLSEEVTTSQSVTEPATQDEIPIVIKTVTAISCLLAISLIFVLIFVFSLTKIKTKKSRYKKRKYF